MKKKNIFILSMDVVFSVLCIVLAIMSFMVGVGWQQVFDEMSTIGTFFGLTPIFFFIAGVTFLVLVIVAALLTIAITFADENTTATISKKVGVEIDALKKEVEELKKIECPHCGARVEKEVDFCPKCGTRLRDALKKEEKK